MEPYRDTSLTPLPPGDAGVAVTLAHLRQLVSHSQTSELAHAAVSEALARTPEKHPGAEAAAILGWVRERYRYQRDPVTVELVRDPRYLLRQISRQGYFSGDCDDASVLLAALLETAGYPTRFVVQAAAGESFSHVLVETELSPGKWVPVDLTNRRSVLGWKPEHVAREAHERRGGMLGQWDGLDAGALADVANAAAMETQARAWESASPDSTPPDFWSRVFSPETLQTVLSVAERIGMYKPIVGYDAQGRALYGPAVPLSGTQAAYSSATQFVGGLPVWGWVAIGIGVVVILVRRRG